MSNPPTHPSASGDPFRAYGRYYDILYQDKDYAGETEYIRSLLTEYAPGSTYALELGCGTGRHASLLAQSGMNVTGVDRSEDMIERANSRIADHSKTGIGQVKFIKGDAQNVSLNQAFDCVLSLFHVVSYQTTNSDVEAMFNTVSSHLVGGGVFIFDVWYGPAVLRQLPSTRIKRMENEQASVLRIAEPLLNFNNNTVEVNYTVLITDKSDGRIETLEERHDMRYFFAPEIALFAKAVGMEVIRSEEWMTGSTPSNATWGVTFVTRKKA